MKKRIPLWLAACLITAAGYGQQPATEKADVVTHINWAMTRQALQNMAAPGDIFAKKQGPASLQVEELDLTAKGAGGEPAKTLITVVPDPTGSLLTIHFEDVPEGHYTLELMSQDGDQLPIEAASAVPGDKRKIGFTSMPFGTYYLRINMMEDRGFFRAYRVIKK